MVRAGLDEGTGFIPRNLKENHAEVGPQIRSPFRGIILRRQEFTEQAAFMVRFGILTLRRMIMIVCMPGTGGGNRIFHSVGIKQDVQIGKKNHRKAVEPAQ